MTTFSIDYVESAMGDIALVTRDDGALCAVDFSSREELMRRRLADRFGPFTLREGKRAGGHASRLRAYLAGDLEALEGAEVEAGGSPFQRRVFAELRRIPVGSTRSYGEVARAIGAGGAARAVGSANNRNPIALFIPCHRVTQKDRTLGGYAGGADRKRWLLHHEGVEIPRREARLRRPHDAAAARYPLVHDASR